MSRWMLLVACLLTGGCGGAGAGLSVAEHDVDAAPSDSGSGHDGGASEAAATEASTDAIASSPPRVAFCASYQGITDGGPPNVYGCGAGWQAFADAGLTVPDSGYAVALMIINSAGDSYPTRTCDSWLNTPFGCLDPEAGLGECQVQLSPGNSNENIANGHCYGSLAEALAGQ